MSNKITAKEFLGRLQSQTMPRASFKEYIQTIRRQIALENDYITSAVNYEEIVMDMVDFDYLDKEFLLVIQFEGE